MGWKWVARQVEIVDTADRVIAEAVDFDKTLEDLEGFLADVVLHALGIDLGGFQTHAELGQDSHHDLVPVARFLGQLPAGIS